MVVSDAVKWGLLVAAIAVLIGMITALPIFAEFDNALGYFSEAVIDFVGIISDYIGQMKGLALMLVPKPIQPVLSALVSFTMLSFLLLVPIKLTKQFYAWIFK